MANFSFLLFSRPNRNFCVFFVLFFFTSCVFGQTVTQNFTAPGTTDFTVPPCVTSVSYVVEGARGGNNGGNGARVSGNLTVTPGQVIRLTVGGQGAIPTAGFNGGGAGSTGTSGSGGGGGASDIRISPFGNANRVVVAGGGGGRGGGSNNVAGGAANCSNGANGSNSFGFGGAGATTAAGGAGGIGWSGGGLNGSAGTTAQGGNGATDFNFGAPGGGGGGGLFGGGGGGGDNCCVGANGGGGGGGGSSLVPAGATCVGGVVTGNGSISISYILPTATLTSTNSNICQGNEVVLTGTVTAVGAWTINISPGVVVTGTGSGTWSTTLIPNVTTTYSLVDITDAVACQNLTGSATFTMPAMGTTLGNNNQSATCLVNVNGWVNFYHSSGRLLASVNSLGQNLGNVTVTNYLDGVNQVMPACNFPTNPSFQTALLQRHWVINPTIQPTTPVLVRLPMLNGEITTLTTVAGSNVNTTDDVASVASLRLSKYSGPANVDANAPNNCPALGGNAGTTIHAQSSNGLTTAYSLVTGAQFSVHSIPNFSEFWLHGSSINSPLPVALTSFSGFCDEKSKQVDLKWETASEINSDYFEVLKSEDGVVWKSIELIQAAGNSNAPLSYSLIDDDVRSASLTYYKLRQFDLDGEFKEYSIISIDCGNFGSPLSIHPNPAQNSFVVSWSIEANQKIHSAVLEDSKGRVVKRIEGFNSSSGSQLVDVSTIASGVYFVHFLGENLQIQSKKLIVN